MVSAARERVLCKILHILRHSRLEMCHSASRDPAGMTQADTPTLLVVNGLPYWLMAVGSHAGREQEKETFT